MSVHLRTSMVTRLAIALAAATATGVLSAPASAGTGWKAITVSSASSATQTLTSVSCSGVGSCVAVGPGAIATLSNGSWTTVSPPLAGLEPAAAAGTAGSLELVSCPAPGSCVAVGDYQDASGALQGLIETLSNGTWAATTAPTAGLSPAAGAFVELTFLSLSCPEAAFCVAVGYYPVDGLRHGLIETLADGSWTATTGPLDNLSPSPDGVATLNDVSCPLAGSCIAVGSYAEADGYDGTDGLIETLAQGTWSSSTTPTSDLSPAVATGPPGDPQPTGDPLRVELQRVSCTVFAGCEALGTYSAPQICCTVQPSPLGLVEIAAGIGGAWLDSTLDLSALSPGLFSQTGMFFSGIACAADGSCLGVGSYADVDQAGEGLVVSGAIGSTMPLSGLSPPVLVPAFAQLGAGPACPTSAACVAAGTYIDSSGHVQGLLETLAGGSWSAASAPVGELNPAADPDPHVQLNAVSCPAAGSCVAVGSYDVATELRAFAVFNVDRTSTSVSCSPATVVVTQPTTCTATVADAEANTTPGGAVAFSSDGMGIFSSASCSLTPTISGQASCSVSYTPTQAGSGTHLITAAYGGDAAHAGGSGTAGIRVTVPQASVSPTTLSFGKVQTRKSSELTVTIANTTLATGNLVVSGIADSGATEFAIDWTASTCANPALIRPSLAPGTSCTVVEKFSPTKSTNTKVGVSGTLTIADNDASSPQTVAMTAK